MGFGSLLRRSFSGAPNTVPDRRASTRRHSAQPRRGQGQDAAEIFYKAKQVYEQEESHIMKEESRRRNQNDRECKRQMQMIERNKQMERSRLDTSLKHRHNSLMAFYRDGRIGTREFEKMKMKHKRQTDEQWNNYLDKAEDEQRKAQRIFFSRGEDIGAETGAALRKAKAKMERSQRIQY